MAETGQGGRLLLVDDDIVWANRLAMLLRNPGYAADVAYDAAGTLLLAREKDHDIVLLDWELPGAKGPEVARDLRALGLIAPILMVSGYHREGDDLVQALDAGADDFLTKPIHLKELLARMGALIRRHSVETAKTWTAGPITMEAGSNEARLGSKVVQLTDTEARVLIVLLRRAPAVVPRSEILAEIFGVQSSTNILDVHVAHLRKKLRSASRMIETVTSVGYRIRANTPD